MNGETGQAPVDSAIEAGEQPLPAAIPANVPETVGGHLRAAREARGLVVADVARSLKLSAHQIEAIEANQWAQMPRTIVRGFIRNYARLVEVDPVLLMELLDRDQQPQVTELGMPASTNVSVPHEGQIARRDYAGVIAGVLVLGLAVLAYFFLPPESWQRGIAAVKSVFASVMSESPKKPVAADAAAETKREALLAPAATVVGPAEPTAAPAAPAADRSAAKPTAGETVAAPAAAQEVTPAPAAPPAPAADGGKARGNTLDFAFEQASWVEVRDRSGNVIFSQLNPAGSRQAIEGKAPFSVVVGNASQVTLSYKGKRVDLGKRSKDDVARVTVE